ncbi:MAG TPA: hypothetical protein VM165_03130 [Planctomycetaceae bacterium]|nr:hypothetical protein [Planctomycetaceae bacterium]
MTIGLDLGTTQFRSLRRHHRRLIGRACDAVYTPLADSPAHRRLLDRDGVRYAEGDGDLLIIGPAAAEWSRLLDVAAIPLLPDGRLPEHDACARELLTFTLDAVLPAARLPGEVCCVTIPGELLPVDESPERDLILPLIRRRGYEPVVISQGLAIVLAELGASQFSGVGISLGASQCEFALAVSGREVARCTIPWGSAELLAQARSSNPDDESAIHGPLLCDFLVELLLEAGDRIGQHDGFRVLSQPVSLACSGGITQARGFDQILQQAWRRAAWPIRLQSIRIAPDSFYTVARGCLIQALLDARMDAIRIAA